MALPPPISYDQIPYQGRPFLESHPDHLAVVARLHGLDPVVPSRARILEIGCGAGANLIPIACERPDATLLGIDLSERQIADGQEQIRRLGLDHIQLEARCLSTLTDDPLEPFDYIIAHGVYSWISSDLQHALLDVCRRHLAPRGLAFVSYNTYPGWHALDALRQLLLFHVGSEPDPKSRCDTARELLDLIAAEPPNPESPLYVRQLQQDVMALRPRSDDYLLHEYLEQHNEPVLYETFVDRAREHDLQAFADARLLTTAAAHRVVGDPGRLARLGLDDPVRAEQYNDFQRNRTFRRTLLVGSTQTPSPLPGLDALGDLQAVSACRPASAEPDTVSTRPETFLIGPSQTPHSVTSPTLKIILLQLSRVWPRSVAVAELHRAVAAELARAHPAPAANEAGADPIFISLWKGYLAAQLEFRFEPAAARFEPAVQPAASPYARLQAETGLQVTNLQHRVVTLTAFERLVLSACDGTRDREALVQVLQSAVRDGHFPLTLQGQPVSDPVAQREILARSLDPCLQRLATASLLI